MTENEIAKIIVDAAYKIHTLFGPGMLESAYEALLVHELKSVGYGWSVSSRSQSIMNRYSWKWGFVLT